METIKNDVRVLLWGERVAVVQAGMCSVKGVRGRIYISYNTVRINATVER